MNKYTVTVLTTIEVPVVANSSDDACDKAEKAIDRRLDAFGNVVGVEAVGWKEG